LFGLQNSDGGFPTFSKGWGKLPFDQSCADLTGHAVLALAKVDAAFHANLNSSQHNGLKKSFVRAITYLEKHQQQNDYWLPLWFGNQHTADHTNPVYGTARVISYLNETMETPLGKEYKIILNLMIERGCRYLASVQNGDKSWGGAKDVK
jgi:squalene-hopene/tetraprenyl-beta-curcumene cyclase